MRGKESNSSDFIARAVAASYHLGLHVTSRGLVNTGKLDIREAKLRDSVFWSCFLVDRMRCTILGMHPYIFCTHISIELPRSSPDGELDENAEIFRDTICFSDVQLKILQDYYSVDFAISASLSGPDDDEKTRMQRCLQLSAGNQLMEEWWRNVSSCSRFQNNKCFNSAHLRVYLLTYRILMNKPLLQHPLKCSLRLASDTSPICACAKSAKEIIEICSSYNLRETLMLPELVYGLYLSSIVCLFNCYSSNEETRKENDSLFLSALELLEMHCAYGQTQSIYHRNLMIFEKQCKKTFCMQSGWYDAKQNHSVQESINSSPSPSEPKKEKAVDISQGVPCNSSFQNSVQVPVEAFATSSYTYDPLWSDFSNSLDPLLDYY